MKLRWYISNDGKSTLQYKSNEDDIDEYWQDVDVELEVAQEWKIQSELRKRIRELEKDYKLLQELKK